MYVCTVCMYACMGISHTANSADIDGTDNRGEGLAALPLTGRQTRKINE